MAITIGTNGYITAAEFRQWADARLYDHYGYNDLEVEAAIVRACLDFIEPNYTFIGEKVDKDQPMSLPTKDVEIAEVSSAVSQAVWQQLQGLLFVDGATVTGQEVLSESSKIGELSDSTTYAEGSRREYTYNTLQIDRLMKPYVIGSAGGIGLLRG